MGSYFPFPRTIHLTRVLKTSTPVRNGLHWGLSRSKRGRCAFSMAFPLRPPLPGPHPVPTEATASPRRWHRDDDPWLPLFLLALTALGRASWRESSHQSEDKVTLPPGFVLSYTHPTALSGCGRQETASMIDPPSLSSPAPSLDFGPWTFANNWPHPWEMRGNWCPKDDFLLRVSRCPWMSHKAVKL